MLHSKNLDVTQLYKQLAVCMESYLQMIFQGSKSDQEMNYLWRTIVILRKLIRRKLRFSKNKQWSSGI